MSKKGSTQSLIPHSLKPILGRYLLVTFCIPFYVDSKGRRYLDKLWVKDLIEHFKYLENFTLASPCRYESPPEDTILLDGNPAFARVKFIDLPTSNSTLEGLTSLPRSFFKLWKAVGEADIVHGSVAGWPIPDGWLLTPIVRLRQKFFLIIVESAFWRLAPNSPKSFRARIRARLAERINRWCINNTDLAIFTQDQYRRSLLTNTSKQGYVINASWIDDSIVMSAREAQEIWTRKLSKYGKELRVLFVGRLTLAKGVRVLLDAMQLLGQQGVPIRLDILGQGDLLAECQKASRDSQLPVHIQVLGTISYGPQFFDLLKDYHAIVIPTISDEQPRIVYDAYSQGVPVLGTATDGMRACVDDGETGKLVDLNNPIALANLLQWASENPEQLARMGLAGLKTAMTLTHEEMHRRRWKILLQTLNASQIMGSRVLA